MKLAMCLAERRQVRDSRHCSPVGEILTALCHMGSDTVLGGAGPQRGDWDGPHLSICLMLMWLWGVPSWSPDMGGADLRNGTPAKIREVSKRQWESADPTRVGTLTLIRWFWGPSGRLWLTGLLESRVHVSVYWQALYLRHRGLNVNNREGTKWVENPCLVPFCLETRTPSLKTCRFIL